MNRIILALSSILFITMPSIAQAQSFISNPTIQKIDSKNVEFQTPNCLNNKNASTDVRLLLLDTNYVNETVVKENVFFEDLAAYSNYSYTFNNDASKYTIMVNGVCTLSSYFDNNRLQKHF